MVGLTPGRDDKYFSGKMLDIEISPYCTYIDNKLRVDILEKVLELSLVCTIKSSFVFAIKNVTNNFFVVNYI